MMTPRTPPSRPTPPRRPSGVIRAHERVTRPTGAHRPVVAKRSTPAPRRLTAATTGWRRRAPGRPLPEVTAPFSIHDAESVESRPLPSSSEQASRTSRAGGPQPEQPQWAGWPRPWRIPPLAWLLVPALILAIWIVASDEDSAERSPGDEAPAAQPKADAEPDGPTPIQLPPPVGNSPRTRPLQTIWLIADDAIDDEATSARVADEVQAAVEHISGWAAVGDGLAIDGGPPRLIQAESERLVQQAGTPPTQPTAVDTAIADAENELGAHPDDHTAVVAVVDGETAAVDAAMASAYGSRRTRNPAPPAQPRDEQPTHTRSVVRLQSGTGRPVSLDATAPLPPELTVDITQRGQLAEVLARIYVESYGGGWQIPE